MSPVVAKIGSKIKNRNDILNKWPHFDIHLRSVYYDDKLFNFPVLGITESAFKNLNLLNRMWCLYSNGDWRDLNICNLTFRIII